MTTLTPYAQQVVSDYLRNHASVAAITTRVMGSPPPKTDTAWIQVTQLDATNNTRLTVERLISYLFQFDCYVGKGEGQPQVNLLARTVRAALDEMRGTMGGAVVTGVKIASHASVPDVEVDKPARERHVLTAEIWMHNAA